ncbi:carboxylic ester hydrolase-like isoform X2 [Danaus plexippus]|uniref:carboxylic ester hydrolase-like isoform X2 n=1 Tax=Danaus plexippus TaxID=13037 RepID=UPI002AB015BF|nr:carboxylic ester hydrolase-like isoform X2 [Danaus plexippus]
MEFLSTSSEMINPIVHVKEGKLRGCVKKLHNGQEYFSFKGIPYAQPPVGDLRFKAPIPPKPWSGTRDALEHGPNCPHFDIFSLSGENIDENCLFLNVYTPTLQTNTKLPVMVYIHGGGYYSGSGDSNLYGPEFLLRHNIVLVTINYRLEVLGFLCLNTPEVPGNAGMKDQVAALKWVQNNIKQFGGDPGNVTIFGESAGGASVTYHMMSPMTKGLFHKAIAQSGTCLCDYALDNDPVNRAFRVGKFLGKDTENPNELLTYLQSLPSKKLISLTMKTATKEEKSRGLPIKFAPVVEKRFGDSEAFLPENPLDILIAGKMHAVPFMTGYNSSEGFLIVPNELPKLAYINKHPSCLVPKDIYNKVSEAKALEFGERIKQFYWGDRDLTKDDIEILTDVLSDVHFVVAAYRYASCYSKYSSPVYMYRFNLVTELNWIQQMLGMTEHKGACHFDDVFYIFSNGMNREKYENSPILQEHIHRITKMWTDFAKTGNPTPDNSLGVTWSPYTATGKEYLQIGNELSMGRNAEKTRLDFWDRLYIEAGLPSLVKSNL